MSLDITGGRGVVEWTIYGYGEPFNDDYYIDAGITTTSFVSGTETRPSGIVDYINAPSEGSDTSSSGSFSYSPGTYTFYSFTQTYNGQYWDTGSGTVTITAPIDPWTWDENLDRQHARDILKGLVPANDFSHTVWNDFVEKVMELRENYGDGIWDTVGGTYLSKTECEVSPGDTLSAKIYNSVKLQIGQIVSTWADVIPGDELTGNHIYDLADKLNEALKKV